MFFHGKSDIGSVRQENQDCFVYTDIGENCFLAAVFDGMGGLSSGAHASNLAKDKFSKYVVKNLEKFKRSSGKIVPADDAAVKNILSDAVAKANHAIFMESMNMTDSAMGTTVAALLVISKKAYVCHVGDSRVYALIQNKLHRLTHDHSLVQYLVDTNEISKDEAEKHPQKNVLMKSVGTEETVTPDISVMNFSKASSYLICSDGINIHISDDEIEKILSEDQNEEEKVDSLMSLAKSRGARDNITALVITP